MVSGITKCMPSAQALYTIDLHFPQTPTTSAAFTAKAAAQETWNGRPKPLETVRKRSAKPSMNEMKLLSSVSGSCSPASHDKQIAQCIGEAEVMSLSNTRHKSI